MKLKLWLIITILLHCLPGSVVAKEAPMIEKGKNVTLHYTLKVDSQIVESSKEREPISFVYGENALVPGFEKGIQGLKEGDKKSMTLAPEEAYGAINPEAIVDVPKTSFQTEQDIQPGMVFNAQGPSGEPVRGLVREVQNDTVKLDFNHPLAGKTLEFDVEIMEIR